MTGFPRLSVEVSSNPRRSRADQPDSAPELLRLTCYGRRANFLQRDNHLFWREDVFTSLFIVESGSFKTYNVDLTGAERVRGFYFPGEVLGLDGIAEGRYQCCAAALEPAVVHRLPFHELTESMMREPRLQTELLRYLAGQYSLALTHAADFTADQRVAEFLLDIERRIAASPAEKQAVIRLSMSRRDIGNFLRLATATVSRTFANLQTRELIRSQGKRVTILDRAGLLKIAEPVLSS